MRRQKFKRKTLIISVLTVIFSFFFSVQLALAEEKLITAPGFFTKSVKVNYMSCEDARKEALKQKAITDGSIGAGSENTGVSISSKDKAKGTSAFKDMAGAATESVVSSDKTNNDGILGINCGTYSFLPNMMKLADTVNITQSSVIMDLVYKFQIAALGIGVLMIALFGAYYAMGNVTIDPVKFLIRGFFVLLLVYFLPWFAQDILNINNIVVHWILTEPINGSVGSLFVPSSIIALVGGSGSILKTWALSTLYSGPIAGTLFAILLFILFIFFLLKPIIVMVFWWYFRFLMLVILVCLGPIFMVVSMLPQTADYGKRWIMFFVGETFTQTSFALAFYILAKILGNLGTLNKEIGMGLIGNVILIIAAFKFLEKVPSLSKRYIGEDFGGLGFAETKELGKEVSDFMKNASFALAKLGADKWQDRRYRQQYAQLENARQELNRLKAAGVPEFSPDFQKAKETLRNIENKMNKERAQRDKWHQLGTNLSKAFSGDWHGAVRDSVKGMEERAEAEAGMAARQEEVKGKEMAEGRRLVRNAQMASRERVLASLNKEEMDAKALLANKLAHIDKKEEEAKKKYEKEHGTRDGFDNSAFEAQRKLAKKDFEKQMNDINSRRKDESYIRSAILARHEKARNHFLGMAEKIVGNQFKSPAERRIAISNLADKLQEEALHGVIAEDKQKMDAKARELDNSVQNYVSTLSKQSSKVADKLGLGKYDATSLLAQQRQLAELNEKNKHLFNPLLTLTSEQQKQKAAVMKQQQALEQNIGNILKGANGGNAHAIKTDLANFERAKGQFEIEYDRGISELAKNFGIKNDTVAELVNTKLELEELKASNQGLLSANVNDLSDADKSKRTIIENKVGALETKIRNMTRGNEDLYRAVNQKTEVIQTAKAHMETAKQTYQNTIQSTIGDAVQEVSVAYQRMDTAAKEYTDSVPSYLNKYVDVRNANEIQTIAATKGVIQNLGAKTIIEDIRNNGGQSVQAMLQIAGVKDDGTIVQKLKMSVSESGNYGKALDSAIQNGGRAYTRTNVIQEFGAKATEHLVEVRPDVKETMSRVFGEYAWERISESMPVEKKVENAFLGSTKNYIETIVTGNKKLEETITNFEEAGIPEARQVAENVHAAASEIKTMIETRQITGDEDKREIEIQKIVQELKEVKHKDVSTAIAQALLTEIQKTGYQSFDKNILIQKLDGVNPFHRGDNGDRGKR